MSSYVSRGIGFRTWIFRKLTEIAAERRFSVSRIVNDAVIEHLGKDLIGVEVEKMRMLAEEDRLLEENQRLFLLIKRVLRDGAYINDAAKMVLLGDENWYGRWQKKAEGVWDRLNVEERDFLLRAFAAREANTKRIVEIERQLLPEERLKMDLVEEGWRLSSRSRKNNFC